ncbi:MAG: hypothetical protein HYS57_00130 [Parcubacteria group bacterium]|nr:hypothetical protein [Parcubacteria group bacterium]
MAPTTGLRGSTARIEHVSIQRKETWVLIQTAGMRTMVKLKPGPSGYQELGEYLARLLERDPLGLAVIVVNPTPEEEILLCEPSFHDALRQIAPPRFPASLGEPQREPTP